MVKDRFALAADVGTVDVRIERPVASYCPTTRIKLSVSHPHQQTVGDSFVFLSIEDARDLSAFLAAVADLAEAAASGTDADATD